MVKREVPKMRTIAAFLSQESDARGSEAGRATLRVEQIRYAEHQPRQSCRETAQQELEASVQEWGVIEPIVVRPLGEERYEVVAGERRLRAAIAVGLERVPVVIKELNEEEAWQLGVVENLQREDLNVVEETEAILEVLARGMKRPGTEVIELLHRSASAQRRGQEIGAEEQAALQAAERSLSKVSRISLESFRSSRLPILKLPTELLEAVRRGDLAYTKAREINRIENAEARAAVIEKAIQETLSLSEIRRLIQQHRKAALQDTTARADSPEREWKQRCQAIGKQLGQKQVWRDAKKRRKAEKLLVTLEALLAEEAAEESKNQS
jgi:ParB family chromosome partitioning protein